jgi:hypothetical protein
MDRKDAIRELVSLASTADDLAAQTERVLVRMRALASTIAHLAITLTEEGGGAPSAPVRDASPFASGDTRAFASGKVPQVTEADGRVRIAFDGKPSLSVRRHLKDFSFRWDELACVWWRKLSPAAWRDALAVVAVCAPVSDSAHAATSAPETKSTSVVNVPTAATSKKGKGEEIAVTISAAEIIRESQAQAAQMAPKAPSIPPSRLADIGSRTRGAKPVSQPIRPIANAKERDEKQAAAQAALAGF